MRIAGTPRPTASDASPPPHGEQPLIPRWEALPPRDGWGGQGLHREMRKRRIAYAAIGRTSLLAINKHIFRCVTSDSTYRHNTGTT